jgi:hypothetical protein
MSYTKNSQNIYKSRYLFKQRLALLTALISIAFLAIVGRFFYLQSITAVFIWHALSKFRFFTLDR